MSVHRSLSGVKRISFARSEFTGFGPQAVIERIEIPQRSSADELCRYYPCRLASPTSTLVHRAVAYALNHVMPDKMAPIW
jgi:hypothetical protein